MLLQGKMENHDSIPVDTAQLEAGNLPSRAYDVATVREIDRALIEDQGIPGITLMKWAAAASVKRLRTTWPSASKVRVYCGSGNNAADGFIVAGLLAEQQLQVEVVVVGDTAKLTPDGQRAHDFCRQCQVPLVLSGSPDFDPEVIVDALLGTGFRGELRPHYVSAIDEINASDAPVLALDVPSGVALDPTFFAQDHTVKADATITFIALKSGLLSGPVVDWVGDLYLAPLSQLASKPDDGVALLSLPELTAQLPKRQKNAHKFDHGHVLVIGGDLGMAGAPLMSALAALRGGAGLVTLITHPAHATTLSGLHPELMVRGVETAEQLEPFLLRADLVAIGPGLGTSAWSEALFHAVFQTDLPLVVDADGLNLLASRVAPGEQTRGNWILTPHPGEARRLLDGELPEDRLRAAKQLSQRYGGVTVLKGAGTLIDAVDSQSLCLYGNPGMSTAGMGDVLCGVIAAVLAQSKDLNLAARLGVLLHSAAADNLVQAAGMRGLFATDLIPEVRRLINA